MKRISIEKRPNWLEQLTEEGILWSTTENGAYWSEAMNVAKYYEFTSSEQVELETAANEIHQHCLTALEMLLNPRSAMTQETRDYYWSLFNIPEFMKEYIITSWESDEWGFYGRFDFIMTKDGPKLLEYNADTPTTLIESSITQWNWFQHHSKKFEDHYQFNEIHESMVRHWGDMMTDNHLYGYLNLVAGNQVDDYATVAYIAETAMEAGCPINLFEIGDIRLKDGMFYNAKEQHINNIFKLYPWEWMIEDEFGEAVPGSATRWIEPSWKMLLSNKAILVMLYEMFPDCKYLVPAYTVPHFQKNQKEVIKLHGSKWVSKPILSREGSNVTFHDFESGTCFETDGPYAEELRVIQQEIVWEPIDGCYPMLGVWMVGDDAVGLGIREDDGLITQNNSRFIPHVVKKD